MSESPILREARAAVFAAVCVLVAIVGHDVFSPGSVPLSWLAACAGLLFIAVRPLTARERGLPSILGAMGAVQLGLHEVFAAAQQHTAAIPAAVSRPLPAIGEWWCGDKAPHGLAALLTSYPASALAAAGITGGSGTSSMKMSTLSGATSPSAGQSMAHSMSHSMGLGMLAAHVLAALAAAWWLRRGEATAWELGRALAIRIVPVLSLLVSPTTPWTPPGTLRPASLAPVGVGPGRLIRFAVARRGPPSAVAAFC